MNQSDENVNILLIAVCFFLLLLIGHFVPRAVINTLFVIGFIIWLIYKWLCNRNNKD